MHIKYSQMLKESNIFDTQIYSNIFDTLPRLYIRMKYGNQ